MQVVGEMLEVFPGGGEDRSRQAERNGIMGGNRGLHPGDGNDFHHGSKKLLLGGGMGEIGVGILPGSDTGFDVVPFPRTDFFQDFPGKNKLGARNGCQSRAKSLDRSGGG